MMKKLLKLVGGLVLTGFMVACGGGGGSSGETNSPVSNPSVADVIFELDKPTIVNTGADAAKITVTVLDASRNVLKSIPVTISLNPDGVFEKSAGDVTDENGQFIGLIKIGSNKSNRVITATIRVGVLTRFAYLQVTGSQISLTPVPATPAPGQSVRLDISTRDSAGAAIPNVTVNLNGFALTATPATTDISGNTFINFTAPMSVGQYSIIASALGTSSTKTLDVIAVGSSGKPTAVGTVSSASVTPSPSTIKPNSSGSTTNRSRLTAKFQTATNVGIENMRVRFEIVSPSLDGQERISTGLATLFTDASGVAEADYIAGIRSSPTNGVKVRACYSPTDFASSSDCPKQVDANLTVAGSPISISISDNNLLEKGLGDIAYVKKFLVQVNDSAGVAVKDAIVSASVDVTHYGKGRKWGNVYMSVPIPDIRNIHSDYAPSPVPANAIPSLQASTVAPTDSQSIWCLNEDWNRNGFLDNASGEDVNLDGSIQPKKASIIVSYVNGNKTDANGQLLVQVSYGQDVGRWLAYTLRVTTGVDGSEGDASKSYVTDVLEDDVENGSFLTPPFGFGSCRVAN